MREENLLHLYSTNVRPTISAATYFLLLLLLLLHSCVRIPLILIRLLLPLPRLVVASKHFFGRSFVRSLTSWRKKVRVSIRLELEGTEEVSQSGEKDLASLLRRADQQQQQQQTQVYL